MKLTKSDRDILKELGYEEQDSAQIQRALNKRNTKYTKYREVINTFNNIPYAENEEPITREEAIKLLGKEDFLNGLARSCFHYSAVREVGTTDLYVSFDSSNLHRN